MPGATLRKRGQGRVVTRRSKEHQEQDHRMIEKLRQQVFQQRKENTALQVRLAQGDSIQKRSRDDNAVDADQTDDERRKKRKTGSEAFENTHKSQRKLTRWVGSLKDDDLAGRMGFQLKDLNKVSMAALKGEGYHRQNELKERAQRSVRRQCYYIDYQHFCNVVKWWIAEMRPIIDSSLRNELDNKGYICPQCYKSFSPLEAGKLIDFAAGTFNCDVCHAELVDNENAESVRGSQDRMQHFNRQMRFIREGLCRTEDTVLSAFDVALWIKMHIISAEKS
ncbi:uncharacterized protein LAESUDRAFT_814927 [Laetiporus sulphureus 93-53]|uniref:Transcription initiation factor IIE subunit alpha N-terminal domain-containing protein n=1 Tax=Laetiporus sulphureus 93-53 TaxID=1314785 RepID=A0A165CMP6_9APHY|nr:uncharacterized protein LAESUDRAFT_814927 [Laetiporus sulphureus 93-53]KZT03091.1 hypothetical protein LAESUDRAFT_814927 [Laetiporus sulphureus 93-53]